MTPTSCFYCGAPDAKWETIRRLFGLKHCVKHTPSAKRDCKAYMHKEKVVAFHHAYKHSILGPFLDILKNLKFPVLRSSGEFQDGWTLQEELTQDTLIEYHDGEWKIPVHYTSPDGDYTKNICKYTPIGNFKMVGVYDPIKYILPDNFQELVDQVVFCLIDGIYFKEYEEVQELQIEKHHDRDDIHTIVLEGGTARVFIPAAREKNVEENPNVV